jgi:hypothetical protein
MRTAKQRKAQKAVTLRDELAMAALQGLLSMQSSTTLGERGSAYFNHGRADLMAIEAYEIADAMLRARNRAPNKVA